jgi:hypothetical protein
MAYFANINECRSVNCFDKIELRGEGTYGQVMWYKLLDYVPALFYVAYDVIWLRAGLHGAGQEIAANHGAQAHEDGEGVHFLLCDLTAE